MITKFETGSAAAAAGDSKGGNTLAVVVVVGLLLVGAYLFVIKPAMDKKKAEENQPAS